jgi:hypothetical protein
MAASFWSCSTSSSGSPAYVLPKVERMPSITPIWSPSCRPPKYMRSSAVVIGKIERLTETRGSPA